MVFTAASEDYNLYSFDMRKLDRPLNVHMDHVAAVIDVDYSPTGRNCFHFGISVADPGCFIPDPDPTIAPFRIRIPDPRG
jgi:hypothetical protein